VRIGLIVFVGSWGGIRGRGRRAIRSGSEGLLVYGHRFGGRDRWRMHIFNSFEQVVNYSLAAKTRLMTVPAGRKTYAMLRSGL
jgi:hypothetical protein